VPFNDTVDCKDYISSVVDEIRIRMERLWNDSDRGKPKYPGHNAILTTINLIWTRLGWNPGFHSERISEK
jgi:hypothetical protein